MWLSVSSVLLTPNPEIPETPSLDLAFRSLKNVIFYFRFCESNFDGLVKSQKPEIRT